MYAHEVTTGKFSQSETIFLFTELNYDQKKKKVPHERT